MSQRRDQCLFNYINICLYEENMYLYDTVSHCQLYNILSKKYFVNYLLNLKMIFYKYSNIYDILNSKV